MKIVITSYSIHYTKLYEDLESSFTIYIPVNKEDDNHIELDSVYFKGKSAKLIKGQKQNMYFARFITNSKHARDIILSSDMEEEHQNKLVITSYSIHYTKLYDKWFWTLFGACGGVY